LLPEIFTALNGIKTATDLIDKYAKRRKEPSESSKDDSELQGAKDALSDIQTKLLMIGQQNLELLEDKRKLTEEIRKHHDWAAKRAMYRLFQKQGATVLRAEDPFPHYACPRWEAAAIGSRSQFPARTV
jgi:hypothetical protein